MKLRVEEGRCQGHGLCHMAAPEIFDLAEEDGHVIIRQPEVPPELEELAMRGVEGCPELALRAE